MRGDGSIFLRGSTYWIKFSVGGRPFSMSTGTSNKTEAKYKLRAEVEKARGPQWLDPQQRKVTIGELVVDLFQWYRTQDRLNTLQDAEAGWRLHLQARFEHVRADLFSTSHQRNYREERLKEGAGNTTVNREFAILRRAYRIASWSEPPKVTRVPHFELTPEDNARKVFIDSATQQKLLKAAAERGLWQRVFLETKFTYGWRVSEILRLFVRNIDLIDGAIRLDKSKNKDAREVPLTPSLRVLYQGLITGKPADSPVFESHHVWYEWKNICALAGVQAGKKNAGYILHDIRRSSARNKRAAGVSTSVIMSMHGWKTEAMFRRYAIVDRSDMLEALRREEEHRTGTDQLQSEPKLLN
jgi:integrase